MALSHDSAAGCAKFDDRPPAAPCKRKLMSLSTPHRLRKRRTTTP